MAWGIMILLHSPSMTGGEFLLRAPNGAPYFAFSGRLAETMRQKGLAAHLSITHEGGFATAFVVLEQAARPAAHTTEATE